MTRVELGRAILYAMSKDGEGKPYTLHPDEVRGLAEELLRLQSIVAEVRDLARTTIVLATNPSIRRIVEITETPPESN